MSPSRRRAPRVGAPITAAALLPVFAASVSPLVPSASATDPTGDPGPTPTVAPTDPPPTDPGPTDPAPTDPAPTDPVPTDPAPTDPAPTDPAPTDAAPSDPGATLAPDPAPSPYDPLDPLADPHGVVPASGSSGDQLAGTTGATWRGQITVWCAACHTRYAAPGSAAMTPSVDPVYTYRHQTNQTACTQCLVAHGSNAVMDGLSSSTYAYPVEPGGAPLSGPSSRLLKIDNRGTCQACHDPTGTVSYTGVRSNP